MRLRNLFLAVLLLFLGAYTAHAAWLFDGTNDYVTLDYNASLVLPDGDWTIAGWIKPTSIAGSSRQYIWTWLNDDASPYAELVIFEGSGAGLPGDIRLDIDDAEGDGALASSNTDLFVGVTDWTHILVERSGATFTVYVNNVSVASASNAAVDGIDKGAGNAWYFGCHSLLTAGRFLDGALAEWAKWDRALSAAERAALSAGFSPNCFPGFSWFPPMVGGVYQELVNGLTVTNNGTVSAPHPRMYSCN